jgi:Uma2 family endonuclease
VPLARLREQGDAVELIDGEIGHKATPSPEHGSAQLNLGVELRAFRNRAGVGGPGGWWLMLEVEVLYPQAGDVYRHDAVGFRSDRHPERPQGAPVAARTDWTCEILSPSTARYDLVKKQRTLHVHGVPHYWILDPEHRTLTVLRHAPEAYLRVLDAGFGDVVRAEPFHAVEISIADLFGVA